MDALLIFGTLAVGIGLMAAFAGVSSAFASAGRIAGAMESITDDSPDLRQVEMAMPFSQRLLGPAFGVTQRLVRSVTPSWWVERIGRNASLAGLGKLGVEGTLALKGVAAVGSAIVFVVGATMSGIGFGGGLMWAVVGGLVGFFVPDLVIARRAEARQADIRRTLPESLDLLAIAVQAGMGLEQAIELVAQRMPGPLGEEMHRMLQEVQLGASRREALQHLRERTDVSELSTFILSLAQADTLGSPLGEVLRVQAQEMRMLRRQRARERAAKVPVKLLFPLLAFIFPALAIVVIGPAIVSILDAFGG